MSNDTSRSPIPIDPETFKSMNKCLPRSMDGSHVDLKSRSRSRSRPNSNRDKSQSASSNERALKAVTSKDNHDLDVSQGA